MIRFNFNCHINKRETPKTCVTNHKGYISHHIAPLVVNSLGGGDTHTCIQTLWTKAISRNQSRAGLQLARAWFKNLFSGSVGVFAVKCFLARNCECTNKSSQLEPTKVRWYFIEY